MSFYTEKAYEVSIARKLMTDNESNELDSKNFNIGYYLLTVIKKGFNFIKISLDWPKTQKYIDFSDEVCEQIDIAYLIKRLNFLDSAISKVIEEHEVTTLSLADKQTLEKAQQVRKKHQISKLIKRTAKNSSSPAVESTNLTYSTYSKGKINIEERIEKEGDLRESH